MKKCGIILIKGYRKGVDMRGVILKNVEKVYPNGFKAVHGIDLEIKPGEFMVLVGPSGCAKSTMLRMIAGLEDITSGELWIQQASLRSPVLQQCLLQSRYILH